MSLRFVTAAAIAGAIAGTAGAAVTEVSIFRQLAARASAGSFATPTVDSHNNTNNVPGLFSDTQMSSVTDAGASSATATQNTTIESGLYFGSIGAAAMAAGNSGGTSSASCSYGASPNNFSTTFSVAFMVDEPTLARFTGTAVATRTGSGGSIICQAILGDVLNGVPQPATIFAQPTANSPAVNWDQSILLIPGHRYSFTTNVNASQSNTFSSNGGSSASNIQFNISIPAPGTAGAIALAGLGALRRRRR